MSAELIAEKLFWHETREVPVRHRVRIVGYRYECCCGWESGLHRRREPNAAATHRRLARLHVAEQVWEALEHGAPDAEPETGSQATAGAVPTTREVVYVARLLSVSLTEDAVRRREKTVTRRLGWWEDKNGRRLLKAGDRLTLVRKAMGRKPGEALVRVAEVEVVDVRREMLTNITNEDVQREGFPADWTWLDFVHFFCDHMKCRPGVEVTRIEWVYLSEVAQVGAQLNQATREGE